MDRNRLIKLSAIILVIGLALWHLYPSIKYYRLTPEKREFKKELRDKAIHLGLDLQGGMYLLFEVDTKGMGLKDTNLATEQALTIIRNRVDQFGVAEPKIQRQGKNRIIVQLPGVKDPKRAKELIGKTALLEFKLVKDSAGSKEDLLAKINNKIPDGYYILKSKEEEKEVFLVKKEAELTGKLLHTASQEISGNRPYVSLEFTREGAKVFREVTGKHVGNRLAIILDSALYSAPVIRERIPSGRAQITGRFTSDEAKDLALVLRAGALPAPLNLFEERTVGPSLGTDSIRKGIKAALVGLLLVAVFMLFYYRWVGLVTDLGLLLTLILLLGGLAGFHATLTLPGIAGIILTIGMAVDANVLIFERIREELKSGKSVRNSLEGGYNRAFLTILDANVTTLIAALVLYYFGSGPIRGFAVTLSLGILASMFSALVFSRFILESGVRHYGKKILSMAHLLTSPNINFISRRKIAYILSLTVIIIGLVAFGIRGKKNFGIDFMGGSLTQLKFTQAVKAETGRKVLKELGLGKSTIQQFNQGKGMIVKSDKDAGSSISTKFKELFQAETIRQEMVGPEVGKDLRRSATLALSWALVGMLIYIAWRFEFRFGVGAIIALFHDVLFAIGIFALTQREFSLPIIAALLTIVGYSINDTIVVFDRIRENRKKMRRESFFDVINSGINQTLNRTLLTSLTTFIVVLALFLLGGEVIHNFAFVMMIGVIVGTYSSIFVASPILVAWQKRSRR
jgi:SecD/SecF fusion protein